MLRFTAIPLAQGSAIMMATPLGLAHLSITRSSATAAKDRAHREFPDAVYDSNLLPSFQKQLSDYLAGRLVNFDVALDLSALTEFQRQVLAACSKIPYGQVLTYGQLARRLGKSQAARAVGNALARNPVCIVIPCHRVIAGDGSLGGYSAEQGITLKRRLLDMERSHPSLPSRRLAVARRGRGRSEQYSPPLQGGVRGGLNAIDVTTHRCIGTDHVQQHSAKDTRLRFVLVKNDRDSAADALRM